MSTDNARAFFPLIRLLWYKSLRISTLSKIYFSVHGIASVRCRLSTSKLGTYLQWNFIRERGCILRRVVTFDTSVPQEAGTQLVLISSNIQTLPFSLSSFSTCSTASNGIVFLSCCLLLTRLNVSSLGKTCICKCPTE